MKNGYDHHNHQDIYTYNLIGPKRFTLDVSNQSPPPTYVLTYLALLKCSALDQYCIALAHDLLMCTPKSVSCSEVDTQKCSTED